MGLLDSLFSGSDGGGGLLDFLKGNAAFQQPAQTGAPGDQAQYPGQPQYAPQPMNAMAQAVMPPQPAQMPSPAQQPLTGQTPAQMPMSASHGGFAQGLGDFLGNLHTGPVGAIVGGLAGGLGLQDSHTRQMQQTQNQTYRYFLSRGVDPVAAQAAVSNPEVMKSMIDQMKPKPPTSLGSGYIYNPQTNKVERAYEPEDKIPAGYERTADGKGLQFIKGGPEDPATKLRLAREGIDPNAPKVLGRGGEIYHVGPDGKIVIDHKNEQNMADATLDDKTTSAMASQYLAGDRTVMQNLGRGAQGAANIVKLRTEIYKQAQDKGLDGIGIVDNFNEQAGALAGQRAVGTRAANISLAANEANNMIGVAVKASEAVPRTQYVPINKAIQMVQTGSSSPELASFVAATNSLVNAYVRAVSPSGVPTDSMREHAYSMLNSAQSHKAYMAVIDTMKKEMDAALKAPGQVREELRRNKTEGSSAEGPKAPVKIDGYTITEH